MCLASFFHAEFSVLSKISLVFENMFAEDGYFNVLTWLDMKFYFLIFKLCVKYQFVDFFFRHFDLDLIKFVFMENLLDSRG